MENKYIRTAPITAIVCPCYNEDPVLADSLQRLERLVGELKNTGLAASGSFILIVDDGSRDRSWSIIEEFHAMNPELFKGVKFSRNSGHQNAIMAGMTEGATRAQVVITLDVDLQDELAAIPLMLQDYREGYDVVYGVKVQREADGFMKRFTAQAFYKMQRAFGIDIIENHADFRMMTSGVIHELEKYGERNLYLRGIIPMLGFRSTTVYDHLSDRKAGKSKYNLSRMVRLAIDGITSFSVRPIYTILWLSIIYMLIAIGIGIYVIVSLIIGDPQHGWSSMMLSLWFIGGTVLMAIGVVGLYVGRIYTEVKQRPRYHIESRLID